LTEEALGLVNPWPFSIVPYAKFLCGELDLWTDLELFVLVLSTGLAADGFERLGSVISDRPLITRMLGSGLEPTPNMASCIA